MASSIEVLADEMPIGSFLAFSSYPGVNRRLLPLAVSPMEIPTSEIGAKSSSTQLGSHAVCYPPTNEEKTELQELVERITLLLLDKL